MFNVTVLKMRDIVKYLVGIMIIIGLIVFATRFFAFKPQNKTETKTVKSSKLIQIGSLKSSLRKTLPAFSIMNENTGNNETTKKENRSNSNYLEEFLKTEISSIKGIEEVEKNNSKEINVSTSDENTDNSNNNTENDSNKNNQNESGQLVLASDNKEKTEIVTPNPITESYNVKYGNVKIKNQTTYNLTEDILKPDIKIDNKNSSKEKYMLKLIEAVGELAKAINADARMKDKEITGTIEEELQDVLYYVTCLANFYGIDLEECVYLKEELNCKKYDRENIFKDEQE